MFTSPDLAADQPRSFEHAHVTRDTRKGHRYRFGQVGDPRATGSQSHEKSPTGRIGQGSVRTIQNVIFNHLVDLIGTS